MKRCLAEGSERFELLVAAAVLANKLMKHRRLAQASNSPPSGSLAHLSQLNLGIVDFEGDERQKSEQFQESLVGNLV